MNYEKLHKETLQNLQEFVRKGKITEETAKGICADFVAESEDEKIFNRICDLIHSAAYANYDVDEDGKECGEYAKIIGWFKSLKERVQPQNHWKPSKEQMHYLSWIANIKLGDSVVEQEVSKHLNELYKQLKQL